MKISVIVTNWNGLDLLKKNLEQIIKMSPEAQEIIIADDASSDKSVNPFIRHFNLKILFYYFAHFCSISVH